MRETSLIQSFLDYWSENGLLSALQRTKWYLSKKFRLAYWSRSTIYLIILKYRIKLLQLLSKDTVSDADPFKIIYVDPSEIQYEVEGLYSRGWGKVVQETWETKPIKERERYQAYENIVNGGTHPDMSQSRVEFIHSLETNGYTTQRELRPLTHHIPFHYRDMEIGVNVDKNGELYWAGWGRNRLCASKVLELDEIAVQVHQRHKKWQELRDEIHNNGLPEGRDDLRDHPDLQDVLD